jgi:hypothetical protein
MGAVAAVTAACLAGAAVSAAWGDTVDASASRAATAVILATAALSLLLLTIAALRSKPGLARRVPAMLGTGLLTGIAVAVIDGIRSQSAAPPLIALATAAIVSLAVLIQHRWVRRRLP